MKGVKQIKSEKKPYITPKLTVHGDIGVITKGNSAGSYLDANFTVGTHFDDLTFSS